MQFHIYLRHLPYTHRQSACYPSIPSSVRLRMLYAQTCWSWLITTCSNWRMATSIQMLTKASRLLSIEGFHLEQKRSRRGIVLNFGYPERNGPEMYYTRLCEVYVTPQIFHINHDIVCSTPYSSDVCYIHQWNRVQCNIIHRPCIYFCLYRLSDLPVQRRNFVTSFHAVEKQIK